MESRVEILYPSETGNLLSFELDVSEIREHGLDEALRHIASSFYEFSSCLGHSRGMREARSRKKPKVSTRLRKQMAKDNVKGLKKIKKAKALVKKIAKTLEKEKEKIDMSKSRELKEKLMTIGLSSREQEIVEEQFDNVKKILEEEGIRGYFEQLVRRLGDLETGLADSDKAWKITSITIGGILMVALALFLLFSPVIIVTIQVVNIIEHGAPQYTYLANSNTKEIHYLYRYRNNCQLDEIKRDHKIYLWIFEEAKELIDDEGYNGCAWCWAEYHKD